jgi:hypothetical protein
MAPVELALDDFPRVQLSPSLSGSNEVLIAGEFGAPRLVLQMSAIDIRGPRRHLGWVELTFHARTPAPMPLWSPTLLKFGYPNEEAFAFGDGFSIGFAGIGLYEVFNSAWQAEIVAQNRYRFPATPNDLGLRHFIVACKENTLEVLAGSVTARRLSTLAAAFDDWTLG